MLKKSPILSNEQGQGMTEYIVIVFIIAIATIPIVTTLSQKIQAKVQQAAQDIDKKLTIKNVTGN